VSTTSNETDVLIIGGGPAGSTFATLMKNRGWDVTLFEKGHHPKFHIGESLLPMNLPILERLGVLDKVAEIGVPKMGADFTIGNSGEDEQTFYFKDALGTSPPQAFEVRRSEFDRLLFEQCQQAGVRTFEGTTVKNARLLDNGSHEVDVVNADGEIVTWKARYLVDASGRDTFLSSRNGWKRRNPKHTSAAVFGHFRSVKRRSGTNQGNISLYWFEYGWIWMIPLRDDVMSIGAVCRPEYLKTRAGSLDDFLLDTLNGIREIRERMTGAEAIVPAQATGNYSYLSDRMAGPGFLMIGDSFAFIDPVFSSGVYLAMNSAVLGVDVAEAWLSGSARAYKSACRRFDRKIRHGLSAFSWFIYRFTSPAMSNLMSNPRNVFQVVRAVISMLAGDVFANSHVQRRLIVFKAIYSISWLLHWRQSWGARRAKLASIRAASQESL
jgi:flavin-dependent dehydrogenase